MNGYVLGTPGSAATITTASGSNGADTWVASNVPTEALGVTDPLRFRVRNDGTRRKAYLRFDLGALGFSLSQTASATLTLFADETDDINPNTIQVYGINDGAAGDALADWSESTLTWDLSAAVQNDIAIGTSVLAGASLVADLIVVANPEGDPNRFNFDEGDAFVFANAGIGLDSFLRADTNGLASFIIIYSEPSGSSLGINTKEDPSVGFPTLRAVSADIDSNGVVDVVDYETIRDNFNNTGPDEADLDGNGRIGYGDFHIWQTAFEAAQMMPASVPEPTAVSLLLLGLAIVSPRTRRTRR